MQILNKLEKIVNWQKEHIKEQTWSYNLPVKDENLAWIEDFLGEKLPQNYIDLYRFADGQKMGGNWMLLGAEFFETDRTKRNLEVAKDILLEFSHETNAFGQDSFVSNPVGAIKKKYYHLKWLPVFSTNGQSDFIGIDFDPDVNGKKGQIITFGRDIENMMVLADDLDSFFDLLLEIIEKEGDKFVKYAHLGNGELLERLLREAKGYPIAEYSAEWQSLEDRDKLYSE